MGSDDGDSVGEALREGQDREGVGLKSEKEGPDDEGGVWKVGEMVWKVGERVQIVRRTAEMASEMVGAVRE